LYFNLFSVSFCFTFVSCGVATFVKLIQFLFFMLLLLSSSSWSCSWMLIKCLPSRRLVLSNVISCLVANSWEGFILTSALWCSERSAGSVCSVTHLSGVATCRDVKKASRTTSAGPIHLIPTCLG
jgi:hypothetical protein